MKRSTVVIIAVILISGFLALVFYGLNHARGVPVIIEEAPKIVLEVPFIDQEIDLTKGLGLEIWSMFQPKEIKMLYQEMVLPWGQKLTSPVQAKAFHNKDDIYFNLSWSDNTEDNIVRVGKFSDACGMMFPLDDSAPAATIMMGFMGRANLWQWKASQDREYWLQQTSDLKAYADFYYPFENEETLPVSKVTYKSAVNDLLAIRVATVTLKDTQNVQGRGIFDNNAWQVVFRRSMLAVNRTNDISFNAGRKERCVLAVWNGANNDRGGRKSISDWVELELK